MIKSRELRDEIIAYLKKKYATASINTDGHYFNASDIAIEDENGEPTVFRIIVVKHRQKKS